MPCQLHHGSEEVLTPSDQSRFSGRHHNKSVCIGTYRLTFEVTYEDGGSIIEFKSYRAMLENPRRDEHMRMHMFVTSPTIMPFPFISPVKTIADFKGFCCP